MQADRAERVRERDHLCNPTDHSVLQQDQGAEALPLPVPPKPEPQEVCQFPQCQESGQHLWHSLSQVLRRSQSCLELSLSMPLVLLR